VISLDLSALRDLPELIDELESSGWKFNQVDFIVAATTEATKPSEAIARLAPFAEAIITVDAVHMISSQPFRLTRTASGALEVASTPNFAPDDLFAGNELLTAQNAWEGDAAAAETLEWSWSVSCQLDLSRLVNADGNRMDVALRPDAVEAAFESVDFEDLKRLVPKGGRRVFVSLDGDAEPLNAGAISILSLSTQLDMVVLPDRTVELPGERPRSIDTAIPSPTSLLPSDTGTSWSTVRQSLSRAAALATWIQIADKFETPHVEYLGFKRTVFDLPSIGEFSQEAAAATLRLRTWAFAEESPDRIMALRQVISLYTDPGPFDSADEVRYSAEPLYVGLRSDAVAEVVRSFREAQTYALDVVHETLQATQSALKSTVERLIAGGIAVAGTIIANISAKVPAETTNWLLAGVGAFFLMLLAVFFVVESPALGLPLENLDDDLGKSAGLLPAARRTELVSSKSVVATRTRVTVVRLTVAFVYGLAAVLIGTLVAHRLGIF
jgi:hypothetical protein